MTSLQRLAMAQAAMVLLTICIMVEGWTPSSPLSSTTRTVKPQSAVPALASTSTAAHDEARDDADIGGIQDCHAESHTGDNRRRWIFQTTGSLLTGLAGVGVSPFRNVALAAEETAATTGAPPPPPTTTTSTIAPSMMMKEFVDPQGLFSLRVPQSFFTLRRSAKGDLPDSKTGNGRRGSSIFTAGNMAKAEVVAVERFPVRVLLEENGIQLSEADDKKLSTFPALGEAKAVANLLVLRRERDTQNPAVKTLDQLELSPDGKTLSFRLKTEIDVQKPELLLEQYGISQLFRITVAKATLDSNDGNLMAIFASALEQDYNNGVDGPALEEVVKSFQVTDQSAASTMAT